jgi:predicted ATPase
VQLCFFTRDIASGDCYVEHPVILSDGQISHWPEGFFDQWELSLEAILAG